MRILVTLENVKMDGVKRATTVLGNSLADCEDVWFYSLADAPAYFELGAPLLIANPPASPELANFFGAHPYSVYGPQIADMVRRIEELAIDTVILPAGLLTSFAPLIKEAVPDVTLIGWMHNNFQTYMQDYYQQMQAEFVAGLQAVDRLVVLTEPDLRDYSKYNANTVKIYNPMTLTPSAHADLDSHIIAFTARIAIQHKGIDLLLQSARFLAPGWKIAMAGSGTPEDMAEFNRLQDEYGVRDRIIYRGALHDEELSQHYASASIFVSTSRWEGMPLVIGEAMAEGLPVVAMGNTGSAEFIGADDYGVLTKPKSVAHFIASLNAMTRSRSMRAYYAQQSLKRAADFNQDQITMQWVNLLKTADAVMAQTA
ncbi:glycosyltransferase [Lacticaseibacillus hulanensis]|uniref:glycosyltransferase n=1 Tax=Lacticaseibacillus hulanensis TaxID=2493111 RepID=UPI000FDBA1F3|nr:glycosyltransferase [Lacticaseibacillus hulanensis]